MPSIAQAGKERLFLFLSILSPFFLLILLAAILELAARLLPAPAVDIFRFKVDSNIQNSAENQSDARITRVPRHLPEPRFKVNNSYLPPEKVSLRHFELQMHLSDDMEFDKEAGYLLKPERGLESWATDATGKEVYHATYHADHWGRRVTPGQEPGKRDHSLLFLGCSFTFGLGLKDEETLPARVAAKTARSHVYNYSFLNWGPGNILRRISKPTLAEEVAERQGTAIYVFTDHHMPLLAGNLSLMRDWPWVRASIPHYFLDQSGALVSSGMFSDARPIETRLFRILAKSAFLERLRFDIPSRFSENDFRLAAAVIQEIRLTLARRLKVEDFYVLFYPDSALAKQLIPFLDAAGIKSIDYSDIELWKFVENPHLSGEFHHPSAESQDFMAGLLVRDLGLQ